MNWSNVDLNDSYQREQEFLDGYNFDTLLLEISCNIKTQDLNKEAIKKHFETVLTMRIEDAKSIFNDNLDNILKQAIKEREDN